MLFAESSAAPSGICRGVHHRTRSHRGSTLDGHHFSGGLEGQGAAHSVSKLRKRGDACAVRKARDSLRVHERSRGQDTGCGAAAEDCGFRCGPCGLRHCSSIRRLYFDDLRQLSELLDYVCVLDCAYRLNVEMMRKGEYFAAWAPPVTRSPYRCPRRFRITRFARCASPFLFGEQLADVDVPAVDSHCAVHQPVDHRVGRANPLASTAYTARSSGPCRAAPQAPAGSVWPRRPRPR